MGGGVWTKVEPAVSCCRWKVRRRSRRRGRCLHGLEVSAWKVWDRRQSRKFRKKATACSIGADGEEQQQRVWSDSRAAAWNALTSVRREGGTREDYTVTDDCHQQEKNRCAFVGHCPLLPQQRKGGEEMGCGGLRDRGGVVGRSRVVSVDWWTVELLRRWVVRLAWTEASEWAMESVRSVPQWVHDIPQPPTPPLLLLTPTTQPPLIRLLPLPSLLRVEAFIISTQLLSPCPLSSPSAITTTTVS